MTTAVSSPVRFIYIDDSGAESAGVVAYSWVSVSADHWRGGLAEVLAWRSWMRDEHGIAKNYELHMTNFANGRGNPSTFGEPWNRHKKNRSIVLDATFSRFGSWAWMSAGTVYSRTNARRDQYRDERARVYRELIEILEIQLADSGEWGVIYMDGDGTDSIYRRAHRDLEIGTRRILEDPTFQHSHLSQWIQIADIVAYSAYQNILSLPEKTFSWGWWPTLDPDRTRTHDVSYKEAGPVIQRSLGGSAPQVSHLHLRGATAPTPSVRRIYLLYSPLSSPQE